MHSKVLVKTSQLPQDEEGDQHQTKPLDLAVDVQKIQGKDEHFPKDTINKIEWGKIHGQTDRDNEVAVHSNQASCRQSIKHARNSRNLNGCYKLSTSPTYEITNTWTTVLKFSKNAKKQHLHAPKKPAQTSKRNFLKSEITISDNSPMDKPKQKQSNCPQSKTLIKERICIKWSVPLPLKIRQGTAQACRCTERRQTGGSWGVPGQPGLQIRHQASQAKEGRERKLCYWLQHGWTSRHHLQKLKEDNQKRQVLLCQNVASRRALTYSQPEKRK